MIKLAGVVVLYHPDQKLIGNIKTYMKDLDVLYAIDNSDQKNNVLVQELKSIQRVVYLDNKGNRGIAHAQNRAAKLAISKNYEWLLTMDQDSYASDDMVSILRSYLETHDTSSLGIISAFHKNSLEKGNKSLQEFEQVIKVMSSGNIINLKAFQEVGGFEEKLFIDMVDFEYCLRLNKAGYKIIVANKAILHHKLGTIKMIDNMLMISHNPARYYYYVRNELYMEKKYKDDFPVWLVDRHNYCVKRYIRTLLYEKHKGKTLYYMIRGYIDYKRSHYGKLK